MVQHLLARSALIGLTLANACRSEPPSSTLHPGDAACEQSGRSWTTTNPYDAKRFGNYFLSNDNFNGTPGQKFWGNSERCFGVTTTSTTERQNVGSYPHVVRGWMQSDGDLRAHSSAGTLDWTLKSGMGLAVTKLKKAKIRWSFEAPTAPGSRWMALMDVYFHKTPTPAANEFPPAVDLMIDQSIADQVVNTTTYYALVAGQSHSTTVTLGAVKYLVYVDNSGESWYHQSGGHTIHLFQLPTALQDGVGPIWGATDSTTRLDLIVKYFQQAAPQDDSGRTLKDAAGIEVSKPLLSPDLFLTAINAGWEVDVGTSFKTTRFWIAMQDEDDGD